MKSRTAAESDFLVEDRRLVTIGGKKYWLIGYHDWLRDRLETRVFARLAEKEAHGYSSDDDVCWAIERALGELTALLLIPAVPPEGRRP